MCASSFRLPGSVTSRIAVPLVLGLLLQRIRQPPAMQADVGDPAPVLLHQRLVRAAALQRPL